MMQQRPTEVMYIHPSRRQFLINELPWMLVASVLVIVGGLDAVPLQGIFLWPALALTLKVLYGYVALRNTVYIITGEQLVFDHGVFTRSRDYIELYRILDFDEKRSFMQMILGLKTVVVHSGDRTAPRLSITGIREDTDVVGVLRDRVAYNRERMNIHEFANYR